MNINKSNIYLQKIAFFIVSLTLSLIPINKAAAEFIADSKLEKYADISKPIRTNDKISVRLLKTSPESVRKIIQKLQSEDAKVRAGAAAILWRTNQQQELVKSALTKALQDKNPIVRANAAKSLGLLASDLGFPESIITLLSQALQDRNHKVRLKAVSALQDATSFLAGEKSLSYRELLVPKLIQALQDINPAVRIKASSFLEDTVTINEIVSNSHLETRIYGRILQSLVKELPILTEALKDDNSQVRLSVVKILREIEEEATPAVPQIIRLLKDENSKVRESAAHALGKIEKKTESASSVPRLAETLKDENPKVRAFAAWSLGNLAEKSKSTVPQLTEALKDDNSKVRSEATSALEKISEGYRNFFQC